MNFLCNFQSPRKNLFNDSQVFNRVKTQGELDNTAKLTVKQFESWIFFMMLHLDLQRFGWVKKKELGRVFEAAIFFWWDQSFSLFLRCRVFFTMFALNVYMFINMFLFV